MVQKCFGNWNCCWCYHVQVWDFTSVNLLPQIYGCFVVMFLTCRLMIGSPSHECTGAWTGLLVISAISHASCLGFFTVCTHRADMIRAPPAAAPCRDTAAAKTGSPECRATLPPCRQPLCRLWDGSPLKLSSLIINYILISSTCNFNYLSNYVLLLACLLTLYGVIIIVVSQLASGVRKITLIIFSNEYRNLTWSQLWLSSEEA